MSSLGQITLATGANLRPQGGLANAGVLDLADGAVSGTSAVTNQAGGVIRGQGSITAPFSNDGDVQVGNGNRLTLATPFANTGAVSLNGAQAILSGGTMTNTGTLFRHRHRPEHRPEQWCDPR